MNESAPEQRAHPVSNRHRVHVLWPDCDPAGILFYGHYFRWMDDATFFLFEAAGLRKDRMLAEYGVPGMPLVSAHADFQSPARFGDVLEVESHVSQAGERSFTVTHVFCADGRVTAKGWEKRVWVHAAADDAVQITARPIPPAVRTALGMPPAEAGRRAARSPCSPRRGPCNPRHGLGGPGGSRGEGPRGAGWAPGNPGEGEGGA